jgi:hypothetical protein
MKECLLKSIELNYNLTSNLDDIHIYVRFSVVLDTRKESPMNVSFKPATHFAAKPKAQKPQQHQQKEVVLEQKPAQFQKGHGAQV